MNQIRFSIIVFFTINVSNPCIFTFLITKCVSDFTFKHPSSNLLKLKNTEPQNDMEELKKILIELENIIPHQELINPLVSKSSVGWHIEHALLTMNLVLESIHKSNPDNYKRTFNLNRILVFTLNKIPRGKVKAPRMVRPEENFTTDSLKNHLEKVKSNLAKLNTLSANNYFEHPFMGHLNLKPTIRFIKIHTNHHLNIIKEIIESKN